MAGLLSICVPIYDFVVTDTVARFLAEADAYGLNVEIVAIDDHSRAPYADKNAQIAEDARVRYLPLLENVGRSRIRNLLADYARGEWLLFMDCDMVPEYDDYLRRYISCMEQEVDVVSGGVHYGPQPDTSKLLLRWRYEMFMQRLLSRASRYSDVNRVTTANFLIRRRVYQRVRFNEGLSGYGQEDRLFNLQLIKRKVRMKHIDNPMRHLGQEDNEKFLLKIHESTRNLVRVWNANPEDRPTMVWASPRLRVIRFLRRLGLDRLLSSLFMALRGRLQQRILCGRMPMFLLSFYQTGYLTYVLRRPALPERGYAIDRELSQRVA